MDEFMKEPPLSAYQVIWKDTLENLFQCGSCGHSLVHALVYATSKLGRTLDVCCLACGEVWAFACIPQGLYEKQQLSHADLDQISKTLDAVDYDAPSVDVPCPHCGRQLTLPETVARGMRELCADKRHTRLRKTTFWHQMSTLFD